MFPFEEQNKGKTQCIREEWAVENSEHLAKIRTFPKGGYGWQVETSN